MQQEAYSESREQEQMTTSNDEKNAIECYRCMNVELINAIQSEKAQRRISFYLQRLYRGELG